MPYKSAENNNLDLNSSLSVSYPIMEHFHTVQGEGVHTGRSAYFIRTGGCDVKCWWCDVKDSWDESKHPKITVDSLLKDIKNYSPAFVVITGGEPLLHDLSALTTGIHSAGLQTHIETSGSSALSGNLDWVTLSPKRFKEALPEVYPYVDELKVVVLTKKDITWAQEHASRCKPGTRLLLQPEWDTPKSMPLIVDFVKKNPQWGISLQTHKFLLIP
ncbi:MAG: 7-carboxy-7-deazaguanine synthase QueE [Balneolales bacterium]|nr:7-carboxy-7-deazaguanine synthase QueE [Balneolales bacterium]